MAKFNGSPDRDFIEGTDNDDRIFGRFNSDTLFGFGGDDEIFGGEGKDFIAGGAGSDWISGGANTDLLFFTGPLDNGVFVDLQANLSTGQGQDTISGIENVFGTDFNDELLGDAQDNFLFGDEGDDQINGRKGDDTVDGGFGQDKIRTGGGFDTYQIFDIDETPVGHEKRDIIYDFKPGTDIISFFFIDADVTTGGIQAFTFIGASEFHNDAGELRFVSGLVEGDVDGDGNADFQIELVGVVSVGPGDFIL